jgi:uncharacterized protein YdaT
VPWPTAKSFRKHNRRSVGAAGQKAANIATGLLKKGASEGKAIRIANGYLKHHGPRRRGLINQGARS